MIIIDPGHLVKKHCTFGLRWLPFFNANYDGGDGDYDDDDIFHETQTKTQFVDSVLFDKNC